MTNKLEIDRELLTILADLNCPYDQLMAAKQRAAEILAAPVVERQETVPKHKFDTLVQHCKRLDAEIAQARAHVNEITLYQQNAVWFWQHDGEDYLKSLSCPIIIQPHHLRELLEGKAQHNPIAEHPAPVAAPEGWKLVPIEPTMHMLEALMEWTNVGNINAYNNILDSAPACLDKVKVKELNQ